MKIELLKEKGIQNLSGSVYVGIVDGVDFTKSGKLENGKPYGASVKLKFIEKVTQKKEIDNIELDIKKSNILVFVHSCEDNEIKNLVAKYSKFLGNEVAITFNLMDGSKFKINDFIS